MANTHKREEGRLQLRESFLAGKAVFDARLLLRDG